MNLQGPLLSAQSVRPSFESWSRTPRPRETMLGCPVG